MLVRGGAFNGRCLGNQFLGSQLVFGSGHLAHYRAGLFREIHRGADDNHGFDSIRLHRRHVEKDVSSHAQPNGAAPANSETIKEGEGVQCTLPMRNRALRIVRPTVAARVGVSGRTTPVNV
jgi:hypothetical protein